MRRASVPELHRRARPRRRDRPPYLSRPRPGRRPRAECDSRYTQLPNGSLRAQPSATTSVRLAPEPDTPRSVTPCVVGLATRDDDRRKRLKPGVLRRASSTAPAAVVRSSADETIDALAAVSTPVAPRDAVTVTDSVSGRGCRTTRSVGSEGFSGVTSSAKPSARTRSVPPADASSTVNRPSTVVSVVRAGLPLLSTVTVAPGTGAPDASITTPVIDPTLGALPCRAESGTEASVRPGEDERDERSAHCSR